VAVRGAGAAIQQHQADRDSAPFSENDQQIQTEVATFRAAIEFLGWNERSNVKFEARWAGGDAGRLQSLAKELVALPCDVILTRNTPVTAAVSRENTHDPDRFRAGSRSSRRWLRSKSGTAGRQHYRLQHS